MAISNKKALEAAKVIADYCKEQAICQNCIFRLCGAENWHCAIGAFDLRDVLSNIEAKRKIMVTCNVRTPMNDTAKGIIPCRRCGVMPRQEYLPRKFPNSITLKTECPKCGNGVIHLVEAGPDGASPEKVKLAMEEHDRVWRELNDGTKKM